MSPDHLLLPDSLQIRPKLPVGNGLNNNWKDVHTGGTGHHTGGNNVHISGNGLNTTGCNGLNTSGNGQNTGNNGLNTGGNSHQTSGDNLHTRCNAVDTTNQTGPPLIVNQISLSQSSGLSNGSVKVGKKEEEKILMSSTH